MVRTLGRRSANLLVALAVFFGAHGSARSAPAAEPDRQSTTSDTCPPDRSLIALFTRQAFDQGRAMEGHEYGSFTDELMAISISAREGEVIEKSISASINFARRMRSLGHEIRAVDLIIHRETTLASLLASDSLGAINRAQFQLQLTVTREMKRVMCR
jgi:hypothetical protein